MLGSSLETILERNQLEIIDFDELVKATLRKIVNPPEKTQEIVISSAGTYDNIKTLERLGSNPMGFTDSNLLFR